jgi:capsular exopolysaccharide synthesis family protein
VDDDDLDLRVHLSVLRRRWSAVVACVVIVAALAVGVSLLQHEIYEGSAEVLIQRQASDQVFNPTTNQVYDPNRDVQTEVKVLESRTVLDAAEKALGHEPDVTISSDSASDVVTVNARSRDPERAAKDADAYAQAYVGYRARSTIDGLLKAGQEVQSKIDDLDGQIAALPPGSPGLSGLEDQQSYLVQQLGRLQVSANLADAGGAQVVARSSIPDAPVSPNPLRNGLIGAILGLLLGIGLAFLLEYVDDAIDDRGGLERAVEGAVPVVGEIPAVVKWKKKDGAYLVSQADPDSPAAEAYRTLRTSVQFLGIDSEVTSFQITSARAEEGKTSTLANLALVLGRAGLKVSVVCGDLRRPRVHEFFGLTNSIGLTSVLLGERNVGEAMQRVPGEPHVALLASGPPPPNPSELLASPRVKEIVAQLEQVSDVVLIDSPPVLPVSDALVIGGLVDATLLVAYAGASSRRALHRAYELLRQVNAPVVGLVLNNAESETSRYGYGQYRHHPQKAAENGTNTTQGPVRLNGRAGARSPDDTVPSAFDNPGAPRR